MEDDADTLHARLERLSELARHAAPKDRAGLERTMHLVSISRQGVAQAREPMERARRLTEEAEANWVHRRSDHAPLHGSPSAALKAPQPLAVMPFMADDPDTQVDGLERLTELAKHASPEGRSLERTIAVVAQSCRTRSLSCKTVQQAREKLTSIKQGTLLTEVRSMDEERRSLAELHILKGRIRK